MRHRFCIALLLALATAEPAQAALSLNQLSSCSSLSSFVHSLDVWPTTCSSPDDRIERALQSRLSIGPAKICFLKESPSPLLAGFNCYQTQTPVGRSIGCIRRVGRADIDDYRNNFLGKYAKPTTQYLGAASTCEIGNKDAATAPPSMLPADLAWVSKMEVGFALSVGRNTNDRLVGASTIVHGFGSVDPNIVSDDGTAIEFLHTWKSIRPATAAAGAQNDANAHITLGNRFDLELDNGSPVTQAQRTMLQNANAQIVVEHLNVIVTRNGGSNEDMRARRTMIDGWQDALAETLEDHGFKEATSSDLSSIGTSEEQMRKKLIDMQPYGWRDRLVQRMGNISIFTKTTPSCGPGPGLLMAITNPNFPVPNAGSDFGEVQFHLMGLAACGQNDGFSIERIRTLKYQLKQKLVEVIGSYQ
jgi:hypothetical protein